MSTPGSSTGSPTPDPERLREQSALLGGMTRGAYVGAMVSLGLRLGLYRALAGAGPVTSEQLAQAAGLHERWVREWLHGQAAAGVIDYQDGGRFELSVESATLLADEESAAFAGHLLRALPHRIGLLERLEESFRTGLGLTWDDRGAEAAAATDGLTRSWQRELLVPVLLPALGGVVERLQAGATVADVGCGSAVALMEMAKAYPRSSFHGYELSTHMLALAGANRDQAGTGNVILHDVTQEPLPQDHSIDFLLTMDCLHDMARPDAVAAAIRAAIRPDGLWFIADVDGAPSLEENLAHPAAPLMYAVSVLSCMSSAMSEPGGAGYGTLGLPEPRMRELVTNAGFTQFRRVDVEQGFNAYYEARP